MNNTPPPGRVMIESRFKVCLSKRQEIIQGVQKMKNDLDSALAIIGEYHQEESEERDSDGDNDDTRNLHYNDEDHRVAPPPLPPPTTTTTVGTIVMDTIRLIGEGYRYIDEIRQKEDCLSSIPGDYATVSEDLKSENHSDMRLFNNDRLNVAINDNDDRHQKHDDDATRQEEEEEEEKSKAERVRRVESMEANLLKLQTAYKDLQLQEAQVMLNIWNNLDTLSDAIDQDDNDDDDDCSSSFSSDINKHNSNICTSEAAPDGNNPY